MAREQHKQHKRSTVRRFGVVLLLSLLLAGCGVSRRLPDGSYLLRRVDVVPDKQAPRKERVTEQEIEKYVRLSTNKRIFGVPFYLWAHLHADTTKEKPFFRRIGEEPVLLDSVAVERSRTNIQTYLHARGYMESTTALNIDTAKKRAYVTYTVTQGEPYRIGRIEHEYQDPFAGALLQKDSASTLLHTGDVFDIGVLDAERVRMTDELKRQGYYNMAVSNVTYLADSLGKGRNIDLKVILKPYLAGYDEKGEPKYENHTLYRLQKITIDAGYRPDRDYAPTDTLEHRGIHVAYKDKPGVRAFVLRRAVSLRSNELYDADQVKRTNANIMRLGYFRSVNIAFVEPKDTTLRHEVTLVGPQGEVQASTMEDYLDCNITCTPSMRQSYKVEFEASATSNFYSLSTTIGYQNRNFVRGLEQFDISGTGTYELMRTGKVKGSWELGATTSITFPRFLLPLYIERYPRITNPRSKLEFSINSQRRPYYRRTISGMSFGYSWGSGGVNSYTVRPIEVSLVKMGYIDQEFWDNLQNPYLQNSYSSQLLAGIGGTYVYNNQLKNIYGNATTVRINWETTGNLFSALTHWLSSEREGEDYYRIFGIRYSQYARIDASVSRKIVLGAKTSLVGHYNIGAGYAYGNSLSMPVDRMFFVGGSNSMRGWLARTLGPGSSPRPPTTLYPIQLGDFRMEGNLEFRFPLWSIVGGALFLDAGNIWFLKKQEYAPSGVFHFDTFYKQLGFNTGLGLRLDLSYTVLRLDWGIRLHDPNLPAGDRWIAGLNLNKTALNIGVGYPF